MGICQSQLSVENLNTSNSLLLRQKREELAHLKSQCQRELRLKETLGTEKLASQQRLQLYKDKIESVIHDVHSGVPLEDLVSSLHEDNVVLESEEAISNVKTHHKYLFREKNHYMSWKKLRLTRRLARHILWSFKESVECY